MLSDTSYITELLNSVCSPRSEEKTFVPINPEWVDGVASLKVSYALRGLLPEESPYLLCYYCIGYIVVCKMVLVFYN